MIIEGDAAAWCHWLPTIQYGCCWEARAPAATVITVQCKSGWCHCESSGWLCGQQNWQINSEYASQDGEALLELEYNPVSYSYAWSHDHMYVMLGKITIIKLCRHGRKSLTKKISDNPFHLWSRSFWTGSLDSFSIVEAKSDPEKEPYKPRWDILKKHQT